mmetsp:Transcript_19132/g.48608  ORF Transcript_19132/g.48608 Transcript_19132/m.48608 type:complete len:475 (-) Transcript_19132:186-1610(-)
MGGGPSKDEVAANRRANEAIKQSYDSQRMLEDERRRVADLERARAEDNIRRQRERMEEINRLQLDNQNICQELKAAKQALEELGRPRRWVHMPSAELQVVAQQRMASMGLSFNKDHVNIAFVGINGSGKSTTLKNLLHLLCPDYDGPLPKVSHVAAGTSTLTPYPVPGMNVTLWDAPGANSEATPAASYVEDQCLAVFNVQVIFIKDRVETLHCDLMSGHNHKYPHQRTLILNARADAVVTELQGDLGSDKNPLGYKQAADIVRNEHIKEASQHGYLLELEDVFVISAQTLLPPSLRKRFARPVGDEKRFLAELAACMHGENDPGSNQRLEAAFARYLGLSSSEDRGSMLYSGHEEQPEHRLSILGPGEKLLSRNRQHSLVMQEDGHLCMYHESDPCHPCRWAAQGTWDPDKGHHLMMQRDGNLVVYNRDGAPKWASNTHGKGSPPFTMELQDNGNLIISDYLNQVVWSTNTAL